MNPSRRLGDGGSMPFVASIQSKSQNSPLISIGLVIVVHFIRNFPVLLDLICNISKYYSDVLPAFMIIFRLHFTFLLIQFTLSIYFSLFASSHSTFNEMNFPKFSGCNSSDWLLLQQFRFVSCLLTLKLEILVKQGF